jgi:flagellin-like protein
MDRRGISPLIATVLIIGFTIVLAVLVITWISGTVTEQTESTDCMVEVESVCLNAVGKVGGSYNMTDGTTTLTNEGGDDYTLQLVGFDSATGATDTVQSQAIVGYQTVTPTYATFAGNDMLRVIPVVDNGECTAECQVIEITGMA